MRYLVLYILLIIGLSTLAISPVSAQGFPTLPGLDISLSSNNPSPGQNITITVKSYNQDISSANIIWTINGSEVKRGVGESTIETKAPALGKINAITVTAVLQDNSRISGSISVGSGSVDLILEPNGHVPPLFLGKINPAFQNKVKVVAIPHLASSNGVEYDPKTLTYEWSRNGIIINNQSGYGKSSVTIEGSLIPRPYTIEVKVQNRNGTSEAKGLIGISPTVTNLSFYVDDPLYGLMFNRAIGNQINLGKERESSVLAVPFGFNKPKDNIGNLSYKWSINGVQRADLETNRSIVLRAPEESGGSSRIDLDIKSSSNILQGALGGFTVLFSAPVTDNSVF